MASGFWGEVIQGLFGNDYLRDFTHASKTFRPNGYQNAPKFKFLFHVYFEINPDAYVNAGNNFGILVKDVQLPTYRFDVKEYNQYNRKRLVQTKINYDPVSISFQDDNISQITDLWNAYYTYYYADGRIPDPGLFDRDQPGGGEVFALNTGGIESQNYDKDFSIPNLYSPDLSNSMNWGYIGESNFPQTGVVGQRLPFFKNITIFGFAQHGFISYTLINPIITEFQHDRYSYDDNGTMKNTMTLNYETVVYNVGYIDGRVPDEIVTGFGTEQNYDRELSPITKIGYNGYVLGQGGLIDSLGGAFKMMQSDPWNAIKQLGKIYTTAKNQYGLKTAGDFRRQVKNEFYQDIVDQLRVINIPSRERARSGIPGIVENPTRNITTAFPSVGATPGVVNTAGAPTTGYRVPNTVIDENGNTNTKFVQTVTTLPMPIEPVFRPAVEPPFEIAEETPRFLPAPVFSEPMLPQIQAFVPVEEISVGVQINTVTTQPPVIPIPQQVSLSGILGYPTDIGLSLGGGLTPNQTVIQGTSGAELEEQFNLKRR